jgi:pyruvate/2-oxoglutarate dehydrogenase complex dihydrolipoamide dehydrogenase (E3) component
MALAQAGLHTILIERKHVGGTCVNEGRITIDLQKVGQRKRDIVDSFRRRSQLRIEKAPNLELVFGDARFAGPKSVEVRLKDGSQRVLSAKNIFINVGTRAAHPRLDGLDSIPFLDNVSIMELDSVPEHLLILGGGYIGLEFGQLFRRLQKRNIRAAKLPMTSVARALEVDETRGFMKAIVDSETNQILGAAVLGIEGGEVMSALEVAMMGKLPYTALRDGVFAHPTLVESLNNLFMAMDGNQ